MHRVYISFTDGDTIEFRCKTYRVFDDTSIFYNCRMDDAANDYKEMETVVISNRNVYAITISKPRGDDE